MSERPEVPEGYSRVHDGEALPAFYAAEMLRPYVGKTVWVADSGGRIRHGILAEAPNVKEDDRSDPPPSVRFEDERPLYLRNIVTIAVYAG